MNDIKTRMEKSITSAKDALSSIRTGRANPDILNKVMVSAYGAMMPINQVATVSVPEPAMLQLNVFDSGVVQSVEKAIMVSNLNLNPSTEGAVIRLKLPELTEERRQELVKVCKKYIEDGKVSIRNIRRDFLESAKSQQKNNDISEDELKSLQDQVQKETDSFISQLDTLLKEKEKEILTV